MPCCRLPENDTPYSVVRTIRCRSGPVKRCTGGRCFRKSPEFKAKPASGACLLIACRCCDDDALAPHHQDVDQVQVSADIGESSPWGLRLRTGDRFAEPCLAPARQIGPAIEEERQAESVPAGLAAHLARTGPDAGTVRDGERAV